MAFSVRDSETDSAVRKLAAPKRLSRTETIRDTVEAAYLRLTAATEKRAKEQLRKPDERAAGLDQFRRTGLKADKAIYDWLSGEEDAG